MMGDIVSSLAECHSVIDSCMSIKPVHFSLPQSCFLKNIVSVNKIKCMPVPLWKGMKHQVAICLCS